MISTVLPGGALLKDIDLDALKEEVEELRRLARINVQRRKVASPRDAKTKVMRGVPRFPFF